jgi:hypothetical protein
MLALGRRNDRHRDPNLLEEEALSSFIDCPVFYFEQTIPWFREWAPLMSGMQVLNASL